MNTEILPGKEEEQIFKFLDEELKNFHEIYEELASKTRIWCRQFWCGDD